MTENTEVRVAIVGVGNCAASLVQGVQYYQDADENKTVQTKIWDRYALKPGVTIDGPAVFEEDESTFIVGPRAMARLLADGSILAEAN